MNTSVTANRIKAARLIAIAADFLQIILFPLCFEGLLSPVNDTLDVLVCVVLTWLVGWHFAFLPSFLIKFAPFAESVPTWTIAILFATRQKSVSSDSGNVTEVYAETSPVPPQLPEGHSQAK